MTIRKRDRERGEVVPPEQDRHADQALMVSDRLLLMMEGVRQARR